MNRVIIIGRNKNIINAFKAINENIAIADEQHDPCKHLRDFLGLSQDPVYRGPSPIDLHPNDDWRGKGNRRKRFK